MDIPVEQDMRIGEKKRKAKINGIGGGSLKGGGNGYGQRRKGRRILADGEEIRENEGLKKGRKRQAGRRKIAGSFLVVGQNWGLGSDKSSRSGENCDPLPTLAIPRTGFERTWCGTL